MIELSNNEFERLKRNSNLSEDKERLAQIERVVNRLAPYVPMPSELIGEEWEFILIEDDDVINAFALPSAKVGVYTGLFKIAKSDADLPLSSVMRWAMLWLNMAEKGCHSKWSH